jgi:nitroreductase
MAKDHGRAHRRLTSRRRSAGRDDTQRHTGAYLARYSEPDKQPFCLDDDDQWPVKFWDIDAAMASMIALLAAVDQGLGGWFFGISSGERALLDHFGVPEGIRPVGVMGFGYRAPDVRPTGSGASRMRRPLEDQIHRNGW